MDSPKKPGAKDGQIGLSLSIITQVFKIALKFLTGNKKNMAYIQVMKSITMYSGPLCNFCEAAKRLLLRNNLEFKEIDISSKEGLMDEMIKKANGKRTIPQIFFDNYHVGGYVELRELEKKGELIKLLK